MSEDKKVLNSLALVMMVLAFIAIVISVIAVGLIDDDNSVQKKWEDERIIKRIKPIGQVATTEMEAALDNPVPDEPEVSVASGPMTGEQVYNNACMACHATGAAGAPKVGDIPAWAPRIVQGDSVLLSHAIKGFKGMPPRGGAAQLSDENVKSAVEFMVSNSQ
ncbi:MAG: cytochrome c, class I [Cycloclasticus sp. symbiont of Poecilosclerida sp. M]|nr:MAG: cytochrome c, class I [Cycloclasticus sp. symbiont of Poecilosclerida sp. M]